jgi:17beta-estradiol 17-dehydrogenase / very-long-chain 3-oxoacyl-CoA reductase
LIENLDIAVLVNNVGASHDMPVPFLQTPGTELEGIISINCLATLRVTQLVGPGMVARKRGLILTMGSFAGLTPTPLLATYSGSKAFLQYWSSALGAELSPHGVTVELVQSYLVTSAMSKIRRPSALVPSARGFVTGVLGKVGRSGGAQGWAYTSAPYWSHGLVAWGLGLIGNTREWVVKWNKDMHEGIRKRALRKREREMERERGAGKKIA